MENVNLTTTVGRVLRAFLEDPQDARYGLQLMQQTGLASGTLYPILARLERAGWIKGEKEIIDTRSAGRPARRTYLLTGEGAQAARIGLAELSAQLSPPAVINQRLRPEGGHA